MNRHTTANVQTFGKRRSN